MRICLLVGDIRAQQPAYAGVHLAWAAQRRDHEVRFVSVHELSFLDDNSVLGMTTRARHGEYARPADYLRALHSEEAVREEEALSGFDVVFVRYNPLHERAGHASPILDLCWRLRLQGVLVINDPEGLRRAGTDMYLADLPVEVRARTLVSRSPARLKQFLRALDGPAVLRALSPKGGEKTFYVRRRQKANVNQMISAITKGGYAVAQEYLPEAEQGEKRIFLLGGAPVRLKDGQVAIYRRLPVLPEGEGDAVVRPPRGKGRRKTCSFGLTEARLCEMLRPKLLADGLYLASVTVVGDKILDLNAFTPSGLNPLREIYGVDVAELVIKDVERRVRLRAAYRTTFDPEAADIV